MNKAFEMILERLEELRETYDEMAFIEMNTNGHTLDFEYSKGKKDVMLDVKKVVQEVAEEYNGGWIACSDRLPEDDYICIVTVEYQNNETVVDYGWFDRKSVCWFVGMHEFRTSNVLAWQPLPEPFKESD